MTSPHDNWWYPDEVADLERMWAEGVPVSEIGSWLGRSSAAVCGKARRLNLPARVVSMAGHGRCPECGNAGYVSYRLKNERVVDACPRCTAEAETAYQQHQRAAHREAAE